MTENEFLKELEKNLWTSANKLLPSLDAAVYKHVMLGQVFLKYIADGNEIHGPSKYVAGSIIKDSRAIW